MKDETLESIQAELMVRDHEISGRVKTAKYSVKFDWVDVSTHGTASENGEFNLQFSESNLGAEIVLQGRLQKEGNRANGKWNTPNCQGALSLSRKSTY